MKNIKVIIFSILLICLFISLFFVSSNVFAAGTKFQTSPSKTPIPTERLLPNYWKWWDEYPPMSDNAIELYTIAIANGRNPNAFSVAGDCQSEPDLFMGIYDTDKYILPEDKQKKLQETIQKFSGSFKWDAVTVKDGMSVASIFVPLWNDPERCETNESPLACEIRLNNPSIMIISLGTNWKPGYQQAFEDNLRKVIEFCIDNHVLPVLATKADNVEGDESTNRTIVNLAYEYDIPMWNFWFAVQELPNHGIDITRGDETYSYLIPNAWEVKSFSGLMMLDTLWRSFPKQ